MMKTFVALFFIIAAGIFAVQGSMNCHTCRRQLLQTHNESLKIAKRLLLGNRPPCEVRRSADEAEYEQNTEECEHGCARIFGFITVKNLTIHMEVRSCYDTKTKPFLIPAPPPPPPLQPGELPVLNPPPQIDPTEPDYTCPNFSYSRIGVKFTENGFQNLTIKFCKCHDELCNGDPDYSTKLDNATELTAAEVIVDYLDPIYSKTEIRAPPVLGILVVTLNVILVFMWAT